jgi:hypothetical protein
MKHRRTSEEVQKDGVGRVEVQVARWEMREGRREERRRRPVG